MNFLDKMDLQNDQVSDFLQVSELIWNFLELPLQATTRRAKSTTKWNPNKGWR